MKPSFSLLAVSLWLFCAPCAQSADLLQIYRQAEANDPQFAAARENLEAGREKKAQGLSGLLPTLALSGNTAWNDIENRSDLLTSTRRYNSNGYSLTLSQPVFRWQNWLNYGQGDIAALIAEAQFIAARQDLMLRVASAYFEVLNAQTNLNAARAQKLAISHQLEQAQRRFEAGDAAIIDTYEAQSRYDLATAQEIAGENELEIRREALRVIIGEYPGNLAQLDARAPILPPDPAQISSWVDAARQESLAVQIQVKNVEMAEKERQKAFSGHYPTLDVVASAGRNRSLSNNGIDRAETQSNVIGLQLNLPIFQGGYVASRSRETAANYAAALHTLESVRRAAEMSARQSYLGVVNGLAQIKALEAALASSLASLDSNKLGYEVGVRINIDVLNAEQQVFSTRRDLARAYHETLMARLRLKNAVGSLAETDLAEINALLKR